MSIHQWIENSGMTASWVQAWGSLAALIIAILLAFYNRKSDIKIKISQQKQYMEAIYLIIENSHEAISWILNDMNSDAVHHHGIYTTHLSRCINALSTITLESLPNPQAYMAIHQLRGDLDNIYSIAFNQSNYDLRQGIDPESIESVELARNRAIEFKEEFDNALASLR